MEIKDIGSFMECYETRSINKAAKSLFISPQGLGKILDRLEAELHISLFERTKQGLIPTEAGVLFYDKCQNIIADVQDLERNLDSIRNQKTIFKVGYSCGLIRRLPMNEVEALQASVENFEISMEEGYNQDIKTKLINGELDVALVIGRLAAADVVEQEIDTKIMCALVPRNHRLFEQSSISIKDLENEQLICLNERYQSYSNLVAACERQGFFPKIRIKTMEAAMIYEFVEDGLGIGIDVDIHKKDFISKDIKLIPIKDGVPWSVYIIYKKNSKNEQLIKRFIELIVK